MMWYLWLKRDDSPAHLHRAAMDLICKSDRFNIKPHLVDVSEDI